MSANAQETGPHSTDSYFTPQRHQWDFSLSDGWEFVDPSGIVRRDNFRDKGAPAGSAIGLSSELGLSTLQLPSLRTTFWFD